MLNNKVSGVFRGLLIVVAIGIWLAIGAVGGQAQGKLASVQENDVAALLPASAESTRAAERAGDFVDSESLPALIVAETTSEKLTAGQTSAMAGFVAGIPALELAGALPGDPQTVGEALTSDPFALPASDGRATLVIVSIDAAIAGSSIGAEETSVNDAVVAAIKTLAERDQDAGGLASTGLQVWVTGPAGFVSDLVTAFAGIDTVLLLVALSAVLVILAFVYRSPTLPLMVILAAVFALALAGLVVYHLALADVLTLSGQSQGILSILVVGAAVDYSLLIVARYREELRHQRSVYVAIGRAMRTSIEPIAASAGTVIAGLLCLMLSELASNRSLGPVAATGIVAAFLAAFTFLPALLVIAGQRSRALFWPRMPTYQPDVSAHSDPENSEELDANVAQDHRVWSRVAHYVGQHDRRIWVVTAVLLAGAAAFVPTLDADGTGDSDVFLTPVDSVAGEKVLAEHFDGISAQPVTVVAPAEDLDEIVRVAQATAGVVVAAPVTDGPPAAPGMPAQGPARVVDGYVRVNVTTSASSDSQEATQTVQEVRRSVHDVSPNALVGGAAAERLDAQIAGQRDLRVIVPVVLAVILVILILLLRSIVAPVLLMAANVLSFGAAMGVAALVFNHVLDYPGADPTVPLFGFCFLVALGVDYSIFLMTRVREESHRVGTQRGVLRALVVTGSVITSAGVVLAATFAALGIIPLLFMAQLAFIVAFGVLLDTLVVRSLLVPALVHDIGQKVWWPTRWGSGSAHDVAAR